MTQASAFFSICTFRMKSNLKYLQERHQNAQLQVFIQESIALGKKQKPCQERPHLLSGSLIKVFYKTTICPRQPLLSGLKSGHLIQV